MLLPYELEHALALPVFLLTLPLTVTLNLLLQLKRIFKHGYYWSPHKKVIVIVGASSGIGASLAERLAAHSQDLKLILCARRQEELNVIAASCRKHFKEPLSAEVQTFKVDIADLKQVKKFIGGVGNKYGCIDALILNAGVSMGESLADLGEDEAIRLLEQITEINYKGLVGAAIYATPFLKASTCSRVVVVSSLLAVAAGPTRSLYCGSKFALTGFFDAFRTELEQTPITVTVVYPGRVATDLNRTRLGRDPAKFDDRQSMTSSDAAALVDEALRKPWIRDLDFNWTGKLLRWVKGVGSDMGDWIMAFIITRVQKKKSH